MSNAEADDYFATRAGSAWSTFEVSEQDAALITSTQLLDGLDWPGYVLSEDQPLSHPRNYNYMDTRSGMLRSAASSAPRNLTIATFELAHHLLLNSDVLDDSGSVLDIALPAIDMKRIQAPRVIPASVRRLLRGLITQSGNAVWRAN